MSLTLTTIPKVEFSSSPVAVSKYNAVHNPIIWKFQREDFVIDEIVVTGTTAHLTMTTVSGDIVFPGDIVYVSNSDITGSFVVTSYVVGVGGFIEFDVTGIAAPGTYPGGFVNLNTTRKSYRIEVQIGMMDTGAFVPLVTFSVVPNVAGVIDVDVSEYLKPQLPLTNTYGYLSGLNLKDLNLSKIYAIKYREVWTTHTGDALSSATENNYITNSAKQIGDLYGGNMAEFTPDDNDVAVTKKAKFLSGFRIPHFWNLFPFDLSFIYADVLSGTVTRTITPRDINLTAGTPISVALLTAGRYYINRMIFTKYIYDYTGITPTWGNNFIIKLMIDGVLTTVATGTFANVAALVVALNTYLGANATATQSTATGINIAAHTGKVYGDLTIEDTVIPVSIVYTVAPTSVYPIGLYPTAYYLDVKLSYSTPFDISETKRIQFETGCTKHPVYLAWKSKNGAWDYWLFDWNQKRRRNIGDVKLYEKYITDFAAARSRIKTSSKTSVPSMVLGASNVPVDDIYYNEQFPGLTGLLESPEVLMLMNPLTWVTDGGPKWYTVSPKPGSFLTLETKNRFSEIELEVTQPYLQIESQ